jgi:hypothetical protein
LLVALRDRKMGDKNIVRIIDNNEEGDFEIVRFSSKEKLFAVFLHLSGLFSFGLIPLIAKYIIKNANLRYSAEESWDLYMICILFYLTASGLGIIFDKIGFDRLSNITSLLQISIVVIYVFCTLNAVYQTATTDCYVRPRFLRKLSVSRFIESII